MKRILISISDCVGVAEVDENGQCDGTQLNYPGQTLRAAIQKHWDADTLLLVFDALFGTGYHSVTTACGAGGVAWTYRLNPIYTELEAIAAHDAMVANAKAGKPAGKSGLTLAFDRLFNQMPLNKERT